MLEKGCQHQSFVMHVTFKEILEANQPLIICPPPAVTQILYVCARHAQVKELYVNITK